MLAGLRRWFLATLLVGALFRVFPQSLGVPLGLDAYMPIPEANPLTPEKVALGRRLFSDRRLSRNQTISCATCHDPQRAFADDRALAVGVFERKGERRVPTLVNRGYGKSFFWDGRISSLEEQVLQPIRSPKEMDMTIEEVLVRLQPDTISEADLAHALASYVRTLLSGHSPYDRHLSGDRDALAPQARQGLEIFRGKGNCIACHLGPNLTDEGFHNTGVAVRQGRLVDLGRSTVTGNEQDRGAFKTPTLREAARRPPYMHDGSLETLEEVVEFYDRGGNPNPYLDAEIVPLKLTDDEKRALVAFLHSLNGTIREGL